MSHLSLLLSIPSKRHAASWILAIALSISSSLLASSPDTIPFSRTGLSDLEEEPTKTLLDQVLSNRQSSAFTSDTLKESTQWNYQAAIVAMELDLPLLALRLSERSLKNLNPSTEENLHDLAARCWASQGEFARAYHHQQSIATAPVGPDSAYWIGAYISFNERLQSATIRQRLITLPTSSSFSTAEAQLITKLQSALGSTEQNAPDAGSGDLDLDNLKAVLQSDLLVLTGSPSTADWIERWELCRDAGLSFDAALAAAQALWNGTKPDASTRLQLVTYLNEKRAAGEAKHANARQLFEAGKATDAFAPALESISSDPADAKRISLAYQAALESQDFNTASAMLALLWQMGSDDFERDAALRCVLTSGDFALLLSMSISFCAKEDITVTDAYYLALSARAWNLPYLEQQALRILADLNYSGNIYSLATLGESISQRKTYPRSLLIGDQKQLPQKSPLGEALAERIRLEAKPKATQSLFPEEQLDQLALAHSIEQLHMAYLFGLIDDDAYEARCTLRTEKAVRNGLLALIETAKSNELTPSQARDLQGLLADPEASDIVKATTHGWLAEQHGLRPPSIRADDPIFVDPSAISPEADRKAAQGAIAFIEHPEWTWKFDQASEPTSQIKVEQSDLWPKENEGSLWFNCDPRIAPCSVLPKTEWPDRDTKKSYATNYVGWLSKRLPADSDTLPPNERVSRNINFIDLIMRSSAPVEARQKTVRDLWIRLDAEQRRGEADGLLSYYLYQDNGQIKDIKEYLRLFSKETRAAIKSYMQKGVASYKKTGEFKTKRFAFETLVESLYPPSSQYRPLAIKMLSQGKSIAELNVEVEKLRKEAELRWAEELRQRAEQARKRQEQAEADARYKAYLAKAAANRARQQQLERESSNYMSPRQMWSAACAGYVQSRMRQPEVIKNYNANGTVQVIVRH